MAARQQLTLTKTRRRDPRAWDFGTYNVLDPEGYRHGGTLLLGNASLDEVEDFLSR